MNIELSKKEVHHLIYALTCAIEKEAVIKQGLEPRIRAIQWFTDLRSRLKNYEINTTFDYVEKSEKMKVGKK